VTSKAGLWLFAGFELALFVLLVPLLVATRHSEAALVGAPVLIAVTGLVGMVVVRHQPRNPVGWVFVLVAALGVLLIDARLYAVWDYRLHGGGLPAGHLAVYVSSALANVGFPLLPIAILLFPDGVLPTRRWRWVFRCYLVLCVLYLGSQFAGEAARVFGQSFAVDVKGQVAGVEHLRGLARIAANSEDAIVFMSAPVFLAFWLGFVVRQVGAWRRADSGRRQQLKWLTTGAVLCLVALVSNYLVAGNSGNSLATLPVATQAVTIVCIAALPLGIGIGILKYSLYEIDRLISRTISYLIVTGLLVSVFLAIVLLATRVLPFSSPVAVAASTLAAAALFNPLRTRVQHVVDRRFNRSRYNAEATVSAFRERLRTATDVDTVRTSLLATVDGSVQPSHRAVWLRPDT
jgi:hypothetical protein